MANVNRTSANSVSGANTDSDTRRGEQFQQTPPNTLASGTGMLL